MARARWARELPRVLLELRATLKPRGVLFSSNPRGDDEEGWHQGRYGTYHSLPAWRRYLTAAGFAAAIAGLALAPSGMDHSLVVTVDAILGGALVLFALLATDLGRALREPGRGAVRPASPR